MKSLSNVLFVDQTSQLGGAELCLADIVGTRRHAGDRVVLFQEGPFVGLLGKAGIDVVVLPLGESGAGVRKSSRLFRKLTATASVWSLARKLAAAASEFDVLYANTAKALVVSAVAGRLAGKPVVFHLHDIVSSDHFSRSNRRLLVGLINHAVRHVIANSLATATALREAGGSAVPITVVANGIDPAPFERVIAETPSCSASCRAALGLLDQPIMALFGRLSPWKGQQVAIDALLQLPGVHLLIIGAALFGEDDFADALRGQVRALGLADRVHFLGFRDDIAAIMRASDVVIHCSTAPEPFGRVIVEAMLAGRPVIASRAGGAAEIVSEGHTGWLFHPGSADELAACARRVLAGEGDVSVVVQRAAMEARTRFDLADRVADINAVIERVVDAG